MTTARSASRVRLLGDPAVVGSDGCIKPLERRAAGLLALVALEPGVTRARAAALLWPESDNARQALRQQIARFRKNYDAELIVGDGALVIAPSIEVDVLGSDGGALLGDLSFDDCEDFAAWLEQARRKRRGGETAGLAQRIAEAEASGDLANATRLAEQLLNADGESESNHRALMRLHYLNGDVAQAQAVYERLARQLKVRFGAQPSAETEAMARALRAAAQRAAPAAGGIPLTVQRPPRLVGRAAEMVELHRVWQERTAAVVLAEAGMGKTRIVSDLALARGHALQAVARPGDGSLPYALVTRLARSALRGLRTPPAAGVARELARLLPELGEAPPLGTDVDRARFLGAVDALLAQAAAEGVQGVVLDDLHYADAASLETLRHAAGADLGLAWIVALRPTEMGVDGQLLLDALARLDAAAQLILSPLTESDVGELLASLDLQLPDMAVLVPQLTRHTGGNPLFLLETIKSLLQQAADAPAPTGQRALALARLPAAPSVASLITRRIGRLRPRSLDLARCAAVAGQDFNAELGAAVLAVRAVDLADAWAELEAAQIFRDGGFAHDLIYEASLASVPQPVAQAMHAAIADWLAANGGQYARVAHHYDRSGRSQRAAPFWNEAGQAAQSALRFAEAADAYERAALGYGVDGQLAKAFDAAYAMRLASFEVDLDQRSSQAIDLMERFAATPEQQARACNERAVTRLHRGDLAGTESAARDGLRALGGENAPLLRAELRRNLAAVHLWRNEAQAALNELRSIEHDIERLGSTVQRAEFHQSLAIVLGHVDEIGAAQRAHAKGIELALQTGNLPSAAQTALNLAVEQHDVGDVHGALATLERARLLLAAVPEQLRSYSSLDLNYGFVLCGLGEYEAALRHFDLAIDNARLQTPGWLPLVLGYRAQCWLHLGQSARAQQDLDNGAPEATTPAVARSKWTVAYAQLIAARGATGAASSDALARLDALLAQLPAGRRLAIWRPLIARLPHLPDDAAIDLAQRVREEAAAVGRIGLAISAGAHLVERLTRTGRKLEAVPLAQQTLAQLDTHAPDNLYRGTVWLQCLPAIAAAEPARFSARLHQAVAWINEVAARCVPASFKESFLERNAANLELRRMLSRAGR
jgi:DNA-binding SARP family transcriptional activator